MRAGHRTGRPAVGLAVLLVAGLVGSACAAPARQDRAGPPGPTPGLEVHFIDAGQGDATLLVAPDATVLVDTGRHTAQDVVTYLVDRGVTALDVVAVTHPHADHLGQFAQVMDRFTVAEVWWSPGVPHDPHLHRGARRPGALRRGVRGAASG
ncbi:MAG TPA: MBL fold metallo-hydrolase [Egibacteraceae bacterium]|nr:MBL fold metallo-hydrolase [Egibacteraceae bacterium]